jgi:uroporphyrinogen-III synthase
MAVLVTRPSPAGEQLVVRLRVLGHQAYHCPLIEFLPGRELPQLADRLATLHSQDLVFVVSQQVINYAQRSLQQRGYIWRADLNYFAIGRTSALQMHSITRLPVAFPETKETSEALLKLPALQNVEGKQALILRGNTGRELLAEHLQQQGAIVSYCECYQRQSIFYDGAQQSTNWQQLNIDTIVITSGEMLQQLYQLVPDYYRKTWLLNCRLVVVSERLATQARQQGWKHIRVAEHADNDALIRALT